MNNKLLETKLKSLEHYRTLINDLEEAMVQTIRTVNELCKDLIEFCPFHKGDIICDYNNKIMMFDRVDHGGQEPDGRPYLRLRILFPNSSDGKFVAANTVYYYFNESEDWTILKHAPVENEKL